MTNVKCVGKCHLKNFPQLLKIAQESETLKIQWLFFAWFGTLHKKATPHGRLTVAYVAKLTEWYSSKHGIIVKLYANTEEVNF